MTREDWLADYLEHGSSGPDQWDADPGPGGRVPSQAAQRLRGRLAEPGSWAEPPDGLLDRILTEIEGERAVLAGGSGRPEPEPTPGSPAGEEVPAGPVQATSRRRSLRHRVLVAGAAAAALAAVTVLGLVATDRPTTTHVAMAGTRLAPGARAVAEVRSTPSGLAIVLDVRDLPPSPQGFHYQAWMKGPDGLVTIGTFHMRGGPGNVDLWSAVGLADYPTLTVTREPEDGNPASSGQVVLTSRP